ncbi:DUF3293 domain-containing protein [Salinisphaera hydrothermalis]|uniref:DUF3293 domain-containing protein n=1 Tax=Salinisphaera hydrothermalis (strain C41B8) TaxID=1304275 RepID=A0A084IJX5_SALHC|nr:DUF3293 domain-containing protein [Salinisphaera hydrothermalis]KEZ77009.1 hypothetical protein C41B8_11855 [Salinisphaera hydrothermalis C41B8]
MKTNATNRAWHNATDLRIMARVNPGPFFAMRARTELSDAFESTDYCAEYQNETVTLNLYHPTPAGLAAWIEGHNGPTPAWLITAYNPGGEAASDRDNRARESLLDNLLDRAGLACLPAVNRDTAGSWPNEPGWLVAGLEEGMARQLGRRFGQAALVAVDRERVDLIWS